MNFDTSNLRFLIIKPIPICAKYTSGVSVHITILNELFQAVTAKCRDWCFFKYFNHNYQGSTSVRPYCLTLDHASSSASSSVL